MEESERKNKGIIGARKWKRKDKDPTVWFWAQYFCPPISMVRGGDGGNVVRAVWACPCLGLLVFLPRAVCEGNGVWCEGKPWPACQEAAHGMKWAQTKQGREEEGCEAAVEKVYGFTWITTTPLFFSLPCDVTQSGRIHRTSTAGHTHVSDWECSGVVGGILETLRRWNVKCLPSCSAKLCFRERWKSHYVRCLTWPYKLWNSFVKFSSGLNELQSGFWSYKSAEDIFGEAGECAEDFELTL